jgi:hypothetical protein
MVLFLFLISLLISLHTINNIHALFDYMNIVVKFK